MPKTRPAPPPWATLLLVAIVIGYGAWQQFQTPPGDRPGPATPSPKSSLDQTPEAPEIAPAPSAPVETPDKPAAAASEVVLSNITIKDQSGRVVYRGEIDLGPTLDRIERGQRHEHRNDGGVFRNLEGRLPKKPSGYYREYVHPTPGVGGPGPQRVVLGCEGEVFYTHDHYQSFRRIR